MGHIILLLLKGNIIAIFTSCMVDEADVGMISQDLNFQVLLSIWKNNSPYLSLSGVVAININGAQIICLRKTALT